MTVPHYTYLVLKMPGPKGIITVKGSFELSDLCDKEFHKMAQNFGMMAKKLSLSSNPAIKRQEVSCVPNTPNTLVICIGALVQQRDSEIQVIWMIISSKCNLK
jgi:hypothetical protein